MPCMDPRQERAREHAYEAARLLCEVLKERPALVHGVSPDLGERLKRWRDEHEKRDAE